jgi:hypothetical protein
MLLNILDKYQSYKSHNNHHHNNPLRDLYDMLTNIITNRLSKAEDETLVIAFAKAISRGGNW